MRLIVLLSLFVVVMPILLAGCGIKDSAAPGVLRKYGLADRPEPGGFDVCKQFGCRSTGRVSLDVDEWSGVNALFLPRPADASEERKRIVQAVSLLEILVGTHIGSSADVARNALAGPGQLDCVAESVNTSVYLLLLQSRGLLVHHRVEAPAHRGSFIFYPHNTAVIRELVSGARFAVDSWYRDNGEAPYVVPLKRWIKGWDPDAGPETEALAGPEAGGNGDGV